MQQPPWWGPPPQYPQHPPYHQGYGSPGYYPAPPEPPPRPKWYQASGPAAVAALLCCWPLGLAFLWSSPAFGRVAKVVLTGATGALVMLAGVGAVFFPKSTQQKVAAIQQPVATPERAGAPRWPTPQEACRLLEDHGFASRRGWMDMVDAWACVANQSPEPPNRIVLHGGGTSTSVTNLHLLLYINQRSDEIPSRHALIRYSDAVFRAVLNKGLPNEVRASILDGTPGRWRFDERDIDLERNNWPSGLGYDQRLVISIPGTKYPARGTN